MKPSTVVALLVATLCGSVCAYQQYCKCQCAANYTIAPVDSCGNCTKTFCQTDYASLCGEVADEAITISCFQIESLKDQIIVYLFVIAVLGLVAYAVVGHHVLDHLR